MKSREIIHKKIRQKIKGSKERPRLNVYRSAKHVYAQIIDDSAGKTLVSTSSGGNVSSARLAGERIAESALALGIKKVVFDRGGYLFHGRVKALAESARSKGLDF